MKKIKVTIEGKEYSGKVKIEGKRKLRFTVFFENRKKTDAKDYTPDQKGYLMAMAHQILREMITSNM